MLTVIYSFTLKPNHNKRFIAAWKEMTFLIQQYEGGLVSSLHKKSEYEYIAYAQWPNRETWENAGNNLPPNATNERDKMRICCENMETTFEMDVVEDLLKM